MTSGAGLRIEVVDLSLAALDALDVDSLAVFVGPERPLQGLAGWVDWRLCGALSRALRDDFYGGGEREALLLPSAGRVGAARIFFFGLPPAPLDPPAFTAFASSACGALAKAGSAAFAAALPPFGGDGARRWIEASLERPVTRQVLLGEAQGLHRALRAALDAMGSARGGVTLAPLQRTPGRPAALPLGSSVVR
jgi:hypothetical protein